MKKKKICKITRGDIVEMAVSATEQVLNEISRNEKTRRNKDIVNAIKGKNSGVYGIKNIAVFTAQNPDSQKGSNSLNKHNNHSLTNDLKMGHYVYMPCVGQWGGTKENSYAIINISINVCKIYNGKYEQTGFVYTTLKDDGTTFSEYYEKSDPDKPYDRISNDYVVKSVAEGYVDMANEEDNFTVIGNCFKYQIPFRALNIVNESIIKNYNKYFIDENRTLNGEIDFCMKHNGMSVILHRKTLYDGIL